MTRSARLLFVLLLATAAGCNVIPIADELQEAVESELLLGVERNSLYLARADYPDGLFDDILASPAAEPPVGVLVIRALDLATGAFRVVEPGILETQAFGDESDKFFGGYGILAGRPAHDATVGDGVWSARVDYAAGFIAVTELASGAETRYLEDLAAAGLPVSVRLIGLAQQRLLVSVESVESEEAALYSFDLATKGELFIDRVAPYDGDTGVSFDGQRVVFVGLGDRTGDNVRPRTLDAVDLATGARQTLVGSLPAVRIIGPFAGGDGVIWVESDRARIAWRTRDDVSGRVRTAAAYDLPASPGYTSVIAATGRAAILETIESSADPTGLLDGAVDLADLTNVTQTIAYAIRTVDGREAEILRYTLAGITLVPNLQPALADDFAVARDPVSREFVIFDLATGDTRRVADR